MASRSGSWLGPLLHAVEHASPPVQRNVWIVARVLCDLSKHIPDGGLVYGGALAVQRRSASYNGGRQLHLRTVKGALATLRGRGWIVAGHRSAGGRLTGERRNGGKGNATGYRLGGAITVVPRPPLSAGSPQPDNGGLQTTLVASSERAESEFDNGGPQTTPGRDIYIAPRSEETRASESPGARPQGDATGVSQGGVRDVHSAPGEQLADAPGPETHSPDTPAPLRPPGASSARGEAGERSVADLGPQALADLTGTRQKPQSTRSKPRSRLAGHFEAAWADLGDVTILAPESGSRSQSDGQPPQYDHEPKPARRQPARGG